MFINLQCLFLLLNVKLVVLCIGNYVADMELIVVRFLTVGWSSASAVHGFGESPSVKSQILNLIRSIRTVTRSKCNFNYFYRSLSNNYAFLQFP